MLWIGLHRPFQNPLFDYKFYRNLVICDFIMPANVCFGWKLDLFKSWWVSVGLKNTLVSRIPVSLVWGPLKTVTSKKSIEFFSTLADRRMAGLWVFRISKKVWNWVSPWSHKTHISSRYLKYIVGFGSIFPGLYFPIVPWTDLHNWVRIFCPLQYLKFVEKFRCWIQNHYFLNSVPKVPRYVYLSVAMTGLLKKCS